MPLPNHITDNVMTVIKGWFDMNSLDHAAKLSANVTVEVYGGHVLHLNAAGEFEMGAEGTEMAIICNQRHSDPDVSRPGITNSGLFMHRAISPTGVMSGVVCEGGFEVSTQTFDTEPTRPYAPNQLLTAKKSSNNNQAVSGVISNDRNGAGGSGGAVLQYTHNVCGVVSRGRSVNEHGADTLTFWTTYLPAAA